MRDVVVIFGLSGSGKSFLSRILNEEFGYEWLRSDVIRKELAGINLHSKVKERFGAGIYSENMTKEVYREMVSRAKELVRRGKKVVLDATFLKRWQRQMVKDSFESPLFILAKASEESIKQRLEDREDVSDADFFIYVKQKEVMDPPNELDYVEVNTERSKEELKLVLSNLIKD